MEVGCHLNQPTQDLPSGAHPDKPSLAERKAPLVRNRLSGLEGPDCFLSLFLSCCAGSWLLRMGFLRLCQAGAALRCGARASRGGVFSCGAQALGAQASVAVACRLTAQTQ